MATITRPPLSAPDPRPYRASAIFAACVIGLASTPATLLQTPFEQSDWPNPQAPRRSIDLLTWRTQALQQTTLAPTLASPDLGKAVEIVGPSFKRVNVNALTHCTQTNLLQTTLAPADPGRAFEVVGPSVKLRTAQTLTAPNLLQTTLAAVAVPFAQEDWPVPRGQPPARQADVSGFSGPVRDYASGLNTAAKPQFDWPVPRGPQRSVDALTWTQSLALQLTRPFAQSDWPNPRGQPPRQADSTGFPQPILDFAVGLNTAARPHIDWPVPRGPQQPISSLTWTQTFQQTPPVAVPFEQTDWPNPRGPQRPVDLLTWTQTGTLLPIPTPFEQTDWPNPRAAARSVDALTWTQNLQQTTLTVVAVPFAQTSWPVPQGGAPDRSAATQHGTRGFPQPILDYANGLNTGLGRQQDWPVPKGPQRSIDLLTWLGPKTQPAPFAQSDWPVPKGRPANPDHIQGFTSGIRDYAGLLNDPNKRPSDWPVPRGPQRSVDLLTWTQSTALLQTSLAVKPINQNDWPLPVPRVYRQIAETRGFENPIRDFAVKLNDANKRKYDWPVPRGPERSLELRTWTQSLVPGGRFAQKPFARTDWPNPQALRQISLTWTQSLVTSTLAVAPVPFAQRDWPNPQIARLLSLYDLGYGLNPAPPVAPVPFAQRHWPNPQIPRLLSLYDLGHGLDPSVAGPAIHTVSLSVTITLTAEVGQRSVCFAQQSAAFVAEAEDSSLWQTQAENDIIAAVDAEAASAWVTQSESTLTYTEEQQNAAWGCSTTEGLVSVPDNRVTDEDEGRVTDDDETRITE